MVSNSLNRLPIPANFSGRTTGKRHMKHLAKIEKMYFSDEHPVNFVTPDKIMARHNAFSGGGVGVIGASGHANNANSGSDSNGNSIGGATNTVSTTANLELHGNGLLLLRFQEDVPVLKQWLQDRYVYM